jgi:hypothetical protein
MGLAVKRWNHQQQWRVSLPSLNSIKLLIIHVTTPSTINWHFTRLPPPPPQAQISAYNHITYFSSALHLIPGLHPQSPRHFASQLSARFSQTLRSSNPSNMIAATRYTDQYWHLHRSDCRNTLIYAHTTSRTLQTCGISIGSEHYLRLNLETLWN